MKKIYGALMLSFAATAIMPSAHAVGADKIKGVFSKAYAAISDRKTFCQKGNISKKQVGVCRQLSGAAFSPTTQSIISSTGAGSSVDVKNLQRTFFALCQLGCSTGAFADGWKESHAFKNAIASGLTTPTGQIIGKDGKLLEARAYLETAAKEASTAKIGTGQNQWAKAMAAQLALKASELGVKIVLNKVEGAKPVAVPVAAALPAEVAAVVEAPKPTEEKLEELAKDEGDQLDTSEFDLSEAAETLGVDASDVGQAQLAAIKEYKALSGNKSPSKDQLTAMMGLKDFKLSTPLTVERIDFFAKLSKDIGKNPTKNDFLISEAVSKLDASKETKKAWDGAADATARANLLKDITKQVASSGNIEKGLVAFETATVEKGKSAAEKKVLSGELSKLLNMDEKNLSDDMINGFKSFKATPQGANPTADKLKAYYQFNDISMPDAMKSAATVPETTPAAGETPTATEDENF